MYAELITYYDWTYERIVTPASTWSGLITFVLALWTWHTITIGRAWRYRHWLKEASAEAGERPAILVVDLSPKTNVMAKMERYRQHNTAIKDVPGDRIFQIQRVRDLTIHDMTALTDELRAKMHEMGRWPSGTAHFGMGLLTPIPFTSGHRD